MVRATFIILSCFFASNIHPTRAFHNVLPTQSFHVYSFYPSYQHGASHYDAGEQLSMFDIVFNLSAVVVGLVVLATGVFSVFSTAT